MKTAFSDRVERARERRDPRFRSSPGDRWGQFAFVQKGVRLFVLASDGSPEVPWEHVSVSTKTRCPTWDEMHLIKGLFWEDDEAVMQLHPPRGDWVSYHPFCLHLWRPLDVAIPLPPSIAVGPRGVRMEELTPHERAALWLARSDEVTAARTIREIEARAGLSEPRDDPEGSP